MLRSFVDDGGLKLLRRLVMFELLVDLADEMNLIVSLFIC